MKKNNVSNHIANNQKVLEATLRRYSWIGRVRPQSLAEPLYKQLGPYERRAIVHWRNVRLYIDPFSHLGQSIIGRSEYETEQCALVETLLEPGSTFLDIGANEGVFSSIAARIVGSDGLVVAVEPQSRLLDTLEINLSLNCRGSYEIYHNAIGEVDGDSVRISLTPLSNTGSSSIVHQYRWSNRSELVPTRSIDSIIEQIGKRQVDLMKVDVEGFEFEVVKSAGTALSQGRIKTLAVDYHVSYLKERGIDPVGIHDFICSAGYHASNNGPENGYNVYTL